MQWQNVSAVIPGRGVLCSFPGPRSCRPSDVHRAITRMAHEIVERNRGLEHVVLIGLQTGGVAIAERLAGTLVRARGDDDTRRYAGRGLLPRRHRPPPRAARGRHRHQLRSHRGHRGAGRRCAVHRSDHQGRAQRVGEYGRAQASSWRSWSTGVTGSCRSDPTTWVRTSPPAGTRWSTCPRRGVPRGLDHQMSPFPTHLLSMDDLGADEIAEVLRVTDSFVEVGRRANPRCPRCGVGPWPPCSSRTRPGPGCRSRRRPSGCRPTCSRFRPGPHRSTRASRARHGRDGRSHRDRLGDHPPESSGVPARVAEWVDRCVVINAGDGWHQHPTQALLDLYTVRRPSGGARGLARFEGLQVAIVGDIATAGRPGRRSRRTRPWAPRSRWWHRPRCCRRRWPDGRSSRHPSPRRRAAQDRRGLAAPGAVGTGQRTVRPHPPRVHGRLRTHRPSGDHAPARSGDPPSRGRSSAVWRSLRTWPSSPASLITEQVSNGVAIRMAVLFLLLGQGPVKACLTCLGAARRRRPARSGDPGRNGGRPARGKRRADVLITGGLIAPVGQRRITHGGVRRYSMPEAVWSPPAWSICTPICVSRDARSRRRWREGARAAVGGYTAVVAMPNTDPALDSADGGQERPRPRGHGHRRGGGGRRHHRGPGRRTAGPDGRAGRPRCHPVHRRRRRRPVGRPHAQGLRLRHRARGDPGPTLRGRDTGRQRNHA